MPRTTAQHCSLLTVANETVTRYGTDNPVGLGYLTHFMDEYTTQLKTLSSAAFETRGRSLTGRSLKMSHVVEDHEGGMKADSAICLRPRSASGPKKRQHELIRWS